MLGYFMSESQRPKLIRLGFFHSMPQKPATSLRKRAEVQR